MNGHGAEIKIESKRESLLPFPGSQVFISQFVNAGFITQSSTGAGELRLHQGHTNQTANREKDRRGNTNYVMYPLHCTCPSILAISYLSLVFITAPTLSISLFSAVHGEQNSSDCLLHSLMETDKVGLV